MPAKLGLAIFTVLILHMTGAEAVADFQCATADAIAYLLRLKEVETE